MSKWAIPALKEEIENEEKKDLSESDESEQDESVGSSSSDEYNPPLKNTLLNIEEVCYNIFLMLLSCMRTIFFCITQDLKIMKLDAHNVGEKVSNTFRCVEKITSKLDLVYDLVHTMVFKDDIPSCSSSSSNLNPLSIAERRKAPKPTPLQPNSANNKTSENHTEASSHAKKKIAEFAESKVVYVLLILI